MKVMAHWSNLLTQMGACDLAVGWCSQFKTPAQAWRALDDRQLAWTRWIAARLMTQATYNRFIRLEVSSARKLVPVPTVADLRAALEAEEMLAKEWLDGSYSNDKSNRLRPWVKA